MLFSLNRLRYSSTPKADPHDYPYPTCCPSTLMLMPDVALRDGSQPSGFLLKKGHGGTTATKVRSVPARPMYSDRRMSCAM